MDLTKHIKLLTGETDWPMWKRKICDMLDYNEGGLDAIDRKLTKPEPLGTGAGEDEIKKHKERSDFYQRANSYAKSIQLVQLLM